MQFPEIPGRSPLFYGTDLGQTLAEGRLPVYVPKREKERQHRVRAQRRYSYYLFTVLTKFLCVYI